MLLLLILRTAWFSDDMAMKVHYCNINSSVMRLFDNNFEKQYRDWYDNKEMFVNTILAPTYMRGTRTVYNRGSYV